MSNKNEGSKTYKILEHPTFGKKAVSIEAWSWLGFLFNGLYFLFKGSFKRFFMQVGIIVVGFTIFRLHLTEFVRSIPFYSRFLAPLTMAIAYFTPIIFCLAHGGLRGNKARFERLLAKGYIEIDEVGANNASHALSVHERNL